MFHKLLLILLLFQVDSQPINPLDLLEQAQKELDDLKSTVNGAISAAHVTLTNILLDFQRKALIDKDHAAIALQTQYQIVFDQIITLGLLSASGGVDGSACINHRQEEVKQSASEYSNNLSQCLNTVDLQALQIENDYTYRVDVVMTKVNNIEHQFNQCGGSLLCLTPILTNIELSKVKYIQEIQLDVSTAQSLLDSLFLIINQCSNSAISGYVSASSIILKEIENCINKLLS